MAKYPITQKLEHWTPSGRALNPAKNETVADGHVWLMSTFNDKSFDSRYFGSIEEHYVVGQLEALWTY